MSVESITPVSTAAVTGTDTNGAPELRTYGNSVTSDGQYAYLYAFVTGYPFRLDQYVARVPMNAPLTGPWQYSSCKVEPTFGQQCPAGQRDWSNDPNAARPMDVGGDPSVGVNGPPIAAFHVVSYGGQYLAVAKAVDLPSSNAADHKVLAWRSTTPMGPWVPVGVLGTATPATASGAFTYVGHPVREMGAHLEFECRQRRGERRRPSLRATLRHPRQPAVGDRGPLAPATT
jgi:hypothetical protein